MKILKSKMGFTLIELLVVIGILAVLAAIAIPSVAGLIERANITADKTNASEMTNSIERFTSEYELYVQDIASNMVDTSNLDAVQGRVYNVCKCSTRSDIENFESSDGINGRGVNINTKYPVNEATFKAVIENYMKTSSATFTPKQSDKSFYYSPEAGVVTVAKSGSSISKLNEIAFKKDSVSLIDNELATMPNGITVHWLNVSLNTKKDFPVVNIMATENENVYDIPVVKLASEPVIDTYNHDAPELNVTVTTNDISGNPTYIQGSYAYMYYENQGGWKISVMDKTKTTYEPMLETINGKPVNDLSYTFRDCTNMIYSPVIPKGVTNASNAYCGCTALISAPITPNNATLISGMFANCTSLKTASNIPNGVTNIVNIYYNCPSLTTAPTIPNSMMYISGAFWGCKSLTTAPTIPNRVMEIYSVFYGCTSLKGTIKFEGTPMNYASWLDGCGIDSDHQIVIVGDNCSNKDVLVRNCGAYVTVG